MLDHTFVAARGLDQQSPFTQIMGAWFFNIDVFARICRKDGGRGVPVVRCGNHNGVHGRVVQRYSEI